MGVHASPKQRTHVLTPIARAYLFAHLSTTAPKAINLVLASLRKKGKSNSALSQKLRHVLSQSLASDQFPAFCGSLVGGTIILQIFFKKLAFAAKRFHSIDDRTINASTRFLAALLSGFVSLTRLNAIKLVHENKDGTEKPAKVQDLVSGSLAGLKAGKTVDLTLFAVVRAADAIIGEWWQRRRSRRILSRRWNALDDFVSSATDPFVFALSSGIVMWAWFYLPERLPPSYNRWISEAAQVDQRLVEALKRARGGTFIYGEETGQASLLQPMCREFGWPEVWGDPAKTIPVPCEMVHMGVGPNCEKHAIRRFLRAFKFGMATYLPLNLFVRLRGGRPGALTSAIKGAVRSSAFLGAFISLFYYSICLTRTRLGPKLFNKKTVTPLQWDSGLCVGAGCAACGWSCLLELPSRRQELALFVAPRAASTFVPRDYDAQHLWREVSAFSLSAAIILTFAQERPARLRGFMGRLIDLVFH